MLAILNTNTDLVNSAELSLLRLEPRAATVSAVVRTDPSLPRLKVAALDAHAFTRLRAKKARHTVELNEERVLPSFANVDTFSSRADERDESEIPKHVRKSKVIALISGCAHSATTTCHFPTEISENNTPELHDV